MKTNRKTLQLAATILLLFAVAPSHAQYARFDQDTDTIAITGETFLGTSATFEAVVLLRASSVGSLYREQGDSSELKTLRLGASLLEGVAISHITAPNGISAAASITLNVFHHVAYVRSLSEERLYLDGVLLASQSETLPDYDINDASSAVHPRSTEYVNDFETPDLRN